MAAGLYNIVCDAGADYEVTFTYQAANGTPIDLTGYTATATFAPQYGSQVLLLSLTSSPAAGITIDGPAGQISLAITNAQTAALGLKAPGGNWVLSIESAGGVITRIVQGAFTVNEGAPA